MAEAAEQTIELGQNFESRRYDALRQSLAPEAGRLAVGAYEALEARREDELKSFIVEALKGEVNTHYAFELVNNQLVAKDGEPIEELLVRGLRADIERASEDQFYEFLPHRSRAELDNFRIAQAMATGQVDYNTVLEISPYNEELDISKENRAKLIQAAQKPYWGRTMVRLSHWDGQRLHIISLSSDNLKNAESFNKAQGTSSVLLFKEATKEEFGYDFSARDANEMLAEPLTLSVRDDSWKNLANRLVTRADQILSARHSGQWHQGRPAEESLNLQSYVDSQQEIIDGLMQAEKRVSHENTNYGDYQMAFGQELYKCIALMEVRQKLGRDDEKIVDYESATAGAGAIARSEGRSYDACGVVLNANATRQPSTANQTGLESLKRLENKPVSCPNCEKKVVVDKKYLAKGELYCKKCGYHLDVCTGKKTIRGRNRNLTSQAFSGFDFLALDFKKVTHEVNIKNILKKQALAETEFEKRRQKKMLQEEQAQLLKLQITA